jgi:phosphoglycerate kinase
MKHYNASALANQRILLRTDLNTGLSKKRYDQSNQLNSLLGTLRELLSINCHVRLLIAKGEPFLQSVFTVEICQYLEAQLQCTFNYCDLDQVSEDRCEKGRVTVLPNAFLSDGDKYNDSHLVKVWLNNIDEVVLDNHHFLDACYASSQGIINSGLTIWMGPSLTEVSKLQSKLKEQRVGLILGGEDVAWQIELAQALSKQVDFIALGHTLTAACIADDSYDPLFDQSVVQHLVDLKLMGINILYPTEVLAYHEKLCRTRVCLVNDIVKHERIKDICLKTVQRIYTEIEKVDTVIFSGVIGQYQDPRFHKGTELLLNYLNQHQVTTVLLGSDIIHAAVCIDKVDHFYCIEGSSSERQLMVDSCQ